MNTRNASIKGIFFSVLVILSIASCRKDTAAPPPPVANEPKGTLLTYTNISSAYFDKIDVIVDGKVMGTITAPYASKPECGAAAAPSNTAIKLSPGKHAVSAIQYKGGEKVGEWEAFDETIKDGYCTRINWVD